MIPATQREALSVLAEVVDLSDDIRLGQLLAHLGFLGEDQTGRSLGNIDDEQLLAVLYHHRGELAARQANAPKQPTGAATSLPGNSKVAEATPATER
ncbi:MAG: hypothetical protein HYR84_00845 [Planctomycetes bacterium]|nr:hypothetical protein [Planctomycetota bacterium]